MDGTALITGTSRGIGRRVAERLAQDGMRVLVAARRIETAPRIPGGEGIALDVASPSSIAALVAQLSARGERIDVLVNNAGVYKGWVRTEMGGPSAPRSIDEGAASVLWGCRLDARGPSGGFFEDGQPLDN